MQSVRRNAQHGVAGLNRAAINDFAAIDHADDTTCEIVFAAPIHSRHLCRLSANERTPGSTACPAKSTQQLRKNLRLQFFRADVIKKKQRTRPEHRDVVNTMIEQIGADGVMLVRRECDLQFGADAIYACDQYRLAHSAKIR